MLSSHPGVEGIPMANFSVGDLVIRKSHGGDVVFRIVDIFCDAEGNANGTLKGLHMRLLADAPLADLQPVDACHLRDEIVRMEALQSEGLRRVMARRGLDQERAERSQSEATKKYNFFDLPGRVLHIDGDEEYLSMCLKTYNQLKLDAVGRWVEEARQPEQVSALVQEFHPDILVLTGHDALIGNGKKNLSDLSSYRTSQYFVQAVKNARLLQRSRDDLVIFAGACQSYFEAILAAGANFASSPTRIFIHAYDPVFIAEKVAFTPICKTVDISDAITASVTGIDGVGGLETRGKFRLGLPKTPY
jgi:spore coat assemly protein